MPRLPNPPHYSDFPYTAEQLDAVMRVCHLHSWNLPPDVMAIMRQEVAQFFAEMTDEFHIRLDPRNATGRAVLSTMGAVLQLGIEMGHRLATGDMSLP